MLIAAEQYWSTTDPHFIPSTLVCQLEEETPKAAAGESNPGPPALAAGALTAELWLPTAIRAAELHPSFNLRVIVNL